MKSTGCTAAVSSTAQDAKRCPLTRVKRLVLNPRVGGGRRSKKTRPRRDVETRTKAHGRERELQARSPPCRCVRGCTAETQPAIPKGKMHTSGDEVWQGVADLQKLRQVKQDTAVRSCSKAKAAVRAGGKAPSTYCALGLAQKEGSNHVTWRSGWDRWKTSRKARCCAERT